MYLLIKSFFDRAFALFLILSLFPLLFLIYIISFFCFGHPVFFAQFRAGYKSRRFLLFKFRTMTNLFDSNGALLPDSERLTRYGRWLRSTSIDELPELINILRGEMSFVGPRPLLMHYLPLYSPHQSRRHVVNPGITGWAQINGRNAISWDKKFNLDVFYVNNQSFWFDLRIILMTFWKVILRDGISAVGEASMAPFTGTSLDQK